MMFQRKIQAMAEKSDEAEAMGAASDKGVVVIAIRKNEDPDKLKLRKFTKDRLGYESDHLLDVLRTQVTDMRGGHSPLMASYVLDQATEPSDFLGGEFGGKLSPRGKYKKLIERWRSAMVSGNKAGAAKLRTKLVKQWGKVRNKTGLTPPQSLGTPVPRRGSSAVDLSAMLGAYDAGVEAESDVLETFGSAVAVGPRRRPGQRRFPLRRRYLRMMGRWTAATKSGDQKKAAFIKGRMETLWPRIRNRKGLPAPTKLVVPKLVLAMKAEAAQPTPDAPPPPPAPTPSAPAASPAPPAPSRGGGSFGYAALESAMDAYFAGVEDELEALDEDDDIEAALGLDDGEFGISKRRRKRLNSRRKKMSPRRRRRLVKKGKLKARHPKRDRYIKLVKKFEEAQEAGSEKKMAHIRGRMAALWPRIKKKKGLHPPKHYKAQAVDEAEELDEASEAPIEEVEETTEVEAAEVDPTSEDEPADSSGSFGGVAGGRFPAGPVAPFSPPRVAGQEVY